MRYMLLEGTRTLPALGFPYQLCKASSFLLTGVVFLDMHFTSLYAGFQVSSSAMILSHLFLLAFYWEAPFVIIDVI